MGKILKASLMVAGLLCLGVLQSAKADAFTGTTFTGVTIYYVGSSATENPFGLTNSCGACANADPFGTGTNAFELGTVTFGSGTLTVTTANLSAAETSPTGTSTANLTVGANVTAIASGTAALLGTPVETWGTQASGSAWCDGTACNDSGANLYFLPSGGSATGNVFYLQDNSLALAFQLGPTSTPEPSSVLMLGGGLLGLMGLGLRRKGLV